MKTYDTLYCKDSTGNIRIWYQQRDGDKFRTVAGVKGSPNLVESDWVIAKPKNIGKANATTAEEQAEAEVKSKYKKQLKTGYFLSINDVDNFQYVEPMLAYHLKDRLDTITFPAMLDRKYNGGRVIVTKDGAFTRKGETWLTIPHIIKALEPLFKRYPDLVIDGEGYNHEFRYKLNKLMSILKKKEKKITPAVLKESEEFVRLYVYDGYGFNGVTEQTGNLQRREALKTFLQDIKYIVVVDYEMVKSVDETYKVYQSYVDDGYEGAMYRSITAPYKHGRSYDLLKVKPEDDAEAKILAIHQGKTMDGSAVTATLLWEGIEFDATFKGCYEDRKVLFEVGGWIGKTVTFLYNGLTGLGTPNFARIDIDNCFKH